MYKHTYMQPPVTPFAGSDNALSRHSGGCPRIYIVAGQLRVVKQMTTTFVSVFSALHEPTFLCLRAKRTFNTISDLKVTDQSPLSGLLG